MFLLMLPLFSSWDLLLFYFNSNQRQVVYVAYRLNGVVVCLFVQGHILPFYDLLTINKTDA